MSRLSLESWFDVPVTLRHALAFTGQLKHRVLINQENVRDVARSLGLSFHQTAGVVRLIQKCGKLSVERLAVIAMNDPGLNDEDIAEIFGRTERWARIVRLRAGEIRKAEPVPRRLEWFDPMLRPEDPSPDEVSRRAIAIRRAKPLEGLVSPRPTLGGIRQFAWGRHAFIPVGT